MFEKNDSRQSIYHALSCAEINAQNASQKDFIYFNVFYLLNVTKVVYSPRSTESASSIMSNSNYFSSCLSSWYFIMNIFPQHTALSDKAENSRCDFSWTLDSLTSIFFGFLWSMVILLFLFICIFKRQCFSSFHANFLVILWHSIEWKIASTFTLPLIIAP